MLLTHTHTHIHIHTHTHTQTHTHTYTHRNTHIYRHTHIHTQTYSYLSLVLEESWKPINLLSLVLEEHTYTVDYINKYYIKAEYIITGNLLSDYQGSRLEVSPYNTEYRGQNDIAYSASGYIKSIYAKNHIHYLALLN